MLQTLHTHISPSRSPQSPSQGLGSGVACVPWLREEFIFTALLYGAWTPQSPLKSPEDSEKLVPCPLE